MHRFITLVSMAGLVAKVNPSPVATKQGAGTTSNQCGTSTFENYHSPNSPLTADCKQMALALESQTITWEVTPNEIETTPLTNYGSCWFIVGNPSPGSPSIFIGNQDVIDLVTDSIARFADASDGRVQSDGEMPCAGTASEKQTLGWAMLQILGG